MRPSHRSRDMAHAHGAQLVVHYNGRQSDQVKSVIKLRSASTHSQARWATGRGWVWVAYLWYASCEVRRNATADCTCYSHSQCCQK